MEAEEQTQTETSRRCRMHAAMYGLGTTVSMEWITKLHVQSALKFLLRRAENTHIFALALASFAVVIRCCLNCLIYLAHALIVYRDQVCALMPLSVCTALFSASLTPIACMRSLALRSQKWHACGTLMP